MLKLNTIFVFFADKSKTVFLGAFILRVNAALTTDYESVGDKPLSNANVIACRIRTGVSKIYCSNQLNYLNGLRVGIEPTTDR